MAVTTLTQDTVPVAVAVGYLAYVSSFPPEVILGAFAGSVIFLLGVANKPKIQWLIYFVLAFAAGVMGAEAISDIVAGLLAIVRITVIFPQGLGAMIAAATVVNVISWLRDHPAHFFRKSEEKV